jgi:hypothetical protein
MPALATITLREPADWQRVVKIVREHAKQMADKGTPLRLIIGKKVAPRSLTRNAFMWADVLEQISQQARANGKRYSPEAWHEEMKRRHLPEVNAKGQPKWRYLEDGTRELAMSTGSLDDDEFDLYLLAVQADAATEYGVIFCGLAEAAECD